MPLQIPEEEERGATPALSGLRPPYQTGGCTYANPKDRDPGFDRFKELAQGFTAITMRSFALGLNDTYL
jgi:hypothetical protein